MDTIKPGVRVRIKRGADPDLWEGFIGQTGTVDRPSSYGWAEWVVYLPNADADLRTVLHANSDELEVLA